MSKVINNRSLTAKELFKLAPPVILCINRPDFERAIVESGYKTISLNLPLARSIAELEQKEISSALVDAVCGILPQNEPVYLTDYEMLFDPRYEIDILRFFVELARQNKLIVKWCGTMDGDTLVYAEQGYEDYRRYKASDYEAVIIK